MGSKCRLAYIPLGHPAINQGAETRIPPTDTLRPAQLGPKPGENIPRQKPETTPEATSPQRPVTVHKALCKLLSRNGFQRRTVSGHP